MAQPRENHFNSSSPRSSTGGVESFRGTPDTRLTAFSPDDDSAKSSKLLKSFSRSAAATPPVRLPVNSYRGSVSHLDKDPFVSPVHDTRLSPTASAFSPDAHAVSFSLSSTERPIATLLSTELGVSHHLDISSSNPLSVSEVDACLTDLVEKGANLHDSREVEGVNGHVYIHFTDIRDACWALSTIRLTKKAWSIGYVNWGQITKDVSEPSNERLTQLGQVLVLATLPPGLAVNATQLTEIVQKVLQSCGQLFALIMLRNIPNKVDQAMLKRIIDESSWGKYDFMYLRIDFANDCNVGYAFINFVDPLDIIDFVNARGNQRWNCFKSDKVAEISYATIQGKDCLVQKFRNSSVMLEAPHYQLAGQEESFPEPDNQSKMKRSCENAEHVGLFTPNAGQHFRDEQRRRRSQYDRGTRLAALEEYDYETAIQQFYGPAAQ
ncbi:hypothetical protein G7Z17_g8797 [Cylindrodendrum hubeiense]|uniref:Mei2-like C-terminal RNA recognition motif domain-containing protein n=1 Tax=Cylindrodendrum hubeiense TaxID=595255 RepID=A0A9P5H563_9HYPO|nr:hypothetical protein G7Z17_g8797 [Cylindrodendrum hubeiense]